MYTMRVMRYNSLGVWLDAYMYTRKVVLLFGTPVTLLGDLVFCGPRRCQAFGAFSV